MPGEQGRLGQCFVHQGGQAERLPALLMDGVTRPGGWRRTAERAAR
ncbi:hypothetical protein [Streptomyces sp. LBL]|nr:hypothetical protein [Streptomyces sp. LBL]